MKTTIKLISACFLLLSVSCKEKDSYIFESKSDFPISNDYSISQEEALANLAAFVRSNNEDTKSLEIYSVSSIIPVRNSPVTKSEQNDNENILYVANFDNGNGYAILSADTRIEYPVLAITESGSLSESTIRDAEDLVCRKEMTIYKGYPTTGPGLFTTPETGDEVFINPNTFNFTVPDTGDTLVGNFSLEGLEPVILPTSFCISYAMNQINRQVDTTDADMGIHGGGGVNTKKMEEHSSEWSDIIKTDNLLSKFVYWHQDSPFNDLYPERRKYLVFGHKEKVSAGCYPLSIAKLLTYFEKPTDYTIDGQVVDWNMLSSDNLGSDAGKETAARLLYDISKKCYSLYFYQGTFTIPRLANRFLRSLGYNNAKSHRYNFGIVKEMIDKRQPLIIFAVPGCDITGSHCWVIDGYKIKGRSVTRKYYEKGKLVNTVSKQDTCRMVHCDFGWSGRANGYYVSGIFRDIRHSVEYDRANDSLDVNFNNYIHLVKYDL